MVFFFDSVKGINSFLNAKQMLMFDAFFNHHDRREQLCIRDLRGRKFQTPTSIICSKKKNYRFSSILPLFSILSDDGISAVRSSSRLKSISRNCKKDLV